MPTVTPAPVECGREQHLIELDVKTFHPRRLTTVRHKLVDHPLLKKDSLIRLAKRLTTPPGKVRYYSGTAAIDEEFKELLDRHGNGATLEETIDRLDEGGSWIAFHHVEVDPEYRELLDLCLDDLESQIHHIDPGMRQRECFIFLSSPGALTPFHLDYEQNLLMQIRGEKRVSLWDADDRTVVPYEALEWSIANYSGENIRYCAEFHSRAHICTLRPGDGVYMPANAPHSAVNIGDTHSITFSACYYSRASTRRHHAHRMNYMLRRRGISPAPVGQSPQRDALKFSAMVALDRVRASLRR